MDLRERKVKNRKNTYIKRTSHHLSDMNIQIKGMRWVRHGACKGICENNIELVTIYGEKR
jgi:hypothetical protein